MLKVKEKGTFRQGFTILIFDNPHIESLIKEKVKLFRKNPHDTRLRNHVLTKRLEGKWAFSVNDSILIVYEWKGENTVVLLFIGEHENVYRN